MHFRPTFEAKADSHCFAGSRQLICRPIPQAKVHKINTGGGDVTVTYMDASEDGIVERSMRGKVLVLAAPPRLIHKVRYRVLGVLLHAPEFFFKNKFRD